MSVVDGPQALTELMVSPSGTPLAAPNEYTMRPTGTAIDAYAHAAPRGVARWLDGLAARIASKAHCGTWSKLSQPWWLVKPGTKKG